MIVAIRQLLFAALFVIGAFSHRVIEEVTEEHLSTSIGDFNVSGTGKLAGHDDFSHKSVPPNAFGISTPEYLSSTRARMKVQGVLQLGDPESFGDFNSTTMGKFNIHDDFSEGFSESAGQFSDSEYSSAVSGKSQSQRLKSSSSSPSSSSLSKSTSAVIQDNFSKKLTHDVGYLQLSDPKLKGEFYLEVLPSLGKPTSSTSVDDDSSQGFPGAEGPDGEGLLQLMSPGAGSEESTGTLAEEKCNFWMFFFGQGMNARVRSLEDGYRHLRISTDCENTLAECTAKFMQPEKAAEAARKWFSEQALEIQKYPVEQAMLKEALEYGMNEYTTCLPGRTRQSANDRVQELPQVKYTDSGQSQQLSCIGLWPKCKRTYILKYKNDDTLKPVKLMLGMKGHPDGCKTTVGKIAEFHAIMAETILTRWLALNENVGHSGDSEEMITNFVETLRDPRARYTSCVHRGMPITAKLANDPMFRAYHKEQLVKVPDVHLPDGEREACLAVWPVDTMAAE